MSIIFLAMALIPLIGLASLATVGAPLYAFALLAVLALASGYMALTVVLNEWF